MNEDIQQERKKSDFKDVFFFWNKPVCTSSVTQEFIDDEKYDPKPPIGATLFGKFCSQREFAFEMLNQTLNSMVRMQQGLIEAQRSLTQFIEYYSTPGPRIKNKQFQELNLDMYDAIKKLWKSLTLSNQLYTIYFCIRLMWPKQYLIKNRLTLSIKYSQVSLRSIPVSVYEVINWFDQIMAYIDSIYYCKYGLELWMKYKSIKMLMNDLYIQILQYMIDHTRPYVRQLK